MLFSGPGLWITSFATRGTVYECFEHSSICHSARTLGQWRLLSRARHHARTGAAVHDRHGPAQTGLDDPTRECISGDDGRDHPYVNAGHNPPMVFRRADGSREVLRLDNGGPVIGLGAARRLQLLAGGVRADRRIGTARRDRQRAGP